MFICSVSRKESTTVCNSIFGELHRADYFPAITFCVYYLHSVHNFLMSASVVTAWCDRYAVTEFFHQFAQQWECRKVVTASPVENIMLLDECVNTKKSSQSGKIVENLCICVRIWLCANVLWKQSKFGFIFTFGSKIIRYVWP